MGLLWVDFPSAKGCPASSRTAVGRLGEAHQALYKGSQTLMCLSALAMP